MAPPFPAAVEDVQAAVAWLRAPAQVSAYGIDPVRIGALGGSAGGNLVGMLATLGDGPRDRGARVEAAVSWSGPMALGAFSADGSGVSAKDSEIVHEYLGCTAFDDACRRRAQQASPITYVDPTDAPLLLAYSTDELVPAQQAQLMSDALQKAGVAHEVVLLPGHAHARQYADRVWTQTVAFLQRYLASTPHTAAPAHAASDGDADRWLVGGALAPGVLAAIAGSVWFVRRRRRGAITQPG